MIPRLATLDEDPDVMDDEDIDIILGDDQRVQNWQERALQEEEEVVGGIYNLREEDDGVEESDSDSSTAGDSDVEEPITPSRCR